MWLENYAVVSALHFAYIHTFGHPSAVVGREAVLGDLNLVEEQWAMLEGGIKGGIATLCAIEIENGFPINVALWNGSDACRHSISNLEGA